MQLIIPLDGTVRCVYGEAIDLSQLGSLSIQRGSSVEPDLRGKWHVDLAPSGGPVLGPFPLRREALAAEERWLLEHWLTSPSASLVGPSDRLERAVIA